MKKFLSVLLISACLFCFVSCGEGVEFYKNATTGTAMLIPGNDFVDMLETADKPVEKIRDPQLFDDVENIIFLANQNFSKHQIGVVSTEDSGCEAWIELDNNGKTLYVKTTGVGFKANEDCKNMFNSEFASCLYNVKKIDFNNVVDTSSVTDSTSMFSGLGSLQYLNLEGCDVSSFNTNPFGVSFCFTDDVDTIVTVKFDDSNRSRLYKWLVNDGGDNSVLKTATETSFKVSDKSFIIRNAKNAKIVLDKLHPAFVNVLGYSGATKIAFRANQYFEDFAGYYLDPENPSLENYTGYKDHTGYVSTGTVAKMFTEVSGEFQFSDASFNLGTTDTAPIWLTVENGTLYVNTTGNQYVGEMTELFKNLTTLKSVDFGNVVDTSLAGSFENMFSGCSAIESVKLGSGFRIKSGATTTNMFASVNPGSELHPVVISFNGTDNPDLKTTIFNTMSDGVEGSEGFIYLNGTKDVKDSITAYVGPHAIIDSNNTSLKERIGTQLLMFPAMKFNVSVEEPNSITDYADDSSAPIWLSYSGLVLQINTTAKYFDFTNAEGFFKLPYGQTASCVTTITCSSEIASVIRENRFFTTPEGYSITIGAYENGQFTVTTEPISQD